jgi:phytoene dehydrogenase-like protein
VTSAENSYDVVVVGGGHNGLVAASYLARAGLSTLVLERLDRLGGGAVSGRPFAGRSARFSRYGDQVSLPEALISDLDLDLRLASSPVASYTPTLRDGKPGGLLVEQPIGARTEASFRALTGDDREYAASREFCADVADLAHVVAPTLLGPLPWEREIRDQVDPGIWRDFVTTPLGVTIEDRFGDETVRGLAAAEAMTGTFAALHDPSLAQNRSFLYHRIGNGTGDRRVPVGGIGAIVDAIARTATTAGAELLTGAGVSAVRGGDDGAEVTWHDGTGSHTVGARFVLADVAPWVLRILLGDSEDPETKPVGSQLEIDLLLDRLPQLESGADPELAFAGRLRVGAGYTELQAAYDDAAAGRLPSLLPGEVRCHSLIDASVVGDEPAGTHTLTLVSTYTPAPLFEADPAAAKEAAVARALATLDQHLVEPIETCLATDADGNPCIDARTPQDIERELARPGGHPFHGDLDWPWAPNRSRLDTPAQQWGVQTDLASVLLCGSGSRRGGGVSGLGGHHAAHAVLATL